MGTDPAIWQSSKAAHQFPQQSNSIVKWTHSNRKRDNKAGSVTCSLLGGEAGTFLAAAAGTSVDIGAQ